MMAERAVVQAGRHASKAMEFMNAARYSTLLAFATPVLKRQS